MSVGFVTVVIGLHAPESRYNANSASRAEEGVKKSSVNSHTPIYSNNESLESDRPQGRIRAAGCRFCHNPSSGSNLVSLKPLAPSSDFATALNVALTFFRFRKQN
jgi:hypothetical protein